MRPMPPLFRPLTLMERARMARRGLCLALVACALLLLLAGCAALAPDPLGWEKIPSRPALPAIHVKVARELLPQACAPYTTAWGCAVRRYDLGLCYIFTDPNPADWQLAHERKHCEGYNHEIR